RNPAPDTKASARRQRTSAFGAGGARLAVVTGRRPVLRRWAPRNAMDRFHRLAFEGAFDRAFEGAFDGTIVPRVRLWLVGLQLVPFWIGRIWMVCAHGNLIPEIVGEFAPQRMLNLTRSWKSAETRLQSAGRQDDSARNGLCV